MFLFEGRISDKLTVVDVIDPQAITADALGPGLNRGHTEQCYDCCSNHVHYFAPSVGCCDGNCSPTEQIP